MENFLELGLPKSLIESLTMMGISKPTPIQEKAIPVALEGKDILGSAATGTGKTAAFSIPLISKIIRDPRATALILTPTRELATQICEAIKLMTAKNCELKTALLIGGDSMFKQLKQLERKPRIIIGTPGRINDHLQRRSLNLAMVAVLVLDETDRMLDMGFSSQIEQIVKFIPKNRQTLLFSATMPKNIMAIANKYLIEPVKIEAETVNAPAKKIKHSVINVSDATKFTTLTDQLTQREGSIIIFVKTKYGADKLATKLCKSNHAADAIHGDLKQRQREKVIQDFRDSKYRILVATDVASRGLDIPHIKHVINYDLPQKPEDFVHRIGRTARAGAEGEAASLILPSDGRMWRDISRMMDPNSKQGGYTSDNNGSGNSGGGNGNGFKGNYRGDRGNFGKKRTDSSRPNNRFKSRTKAAA